jgi:hypothetical protein
LLDADSPLFVSQQSPTPSAVTTSEALPLEELNLEEQHSEKAHPEELKSEGLHPGRTRPGEMLQDTIRIVVPPVQRRWEYQVYHEEVSVDEVLEEFNDSEELHFLVKLSDGNEVTVSQDSANSDGRIPTSTKNQDL